MSNRYTWEEETTNRLGRIAHRMSILLELLLVSEEGVKWGADHTGWYYNIICLKRVSLSVYAVCNVT